MAWTNILIITVGESPPVVTETVWALFHRRKDEQPDPFIPDRIHLVTTARGQQVFSDHLIGPGKKLEELLDTFGHKLALVEVNLPEAPDGAEMHDIRTAAENVAYANTVSRLIKLYSDDPATRVHVSLAGGRKTMSYYAGAAISLFGRDQDELSHVLVLPEELEQCDGFWWPGQPEAWVPHRREKDRNGQPLTFSTGTADATVDLALIPFVRLKHIVTEEAFPGGEVDYEHVVRSVQESLDTQRVVLLCDDRLLIVGPYSIRLPHFQFALYRLVATARQLNWAGAGPRGLGKAEKGWVDYDQLLRLDAPLLPHFEKFYDAAFRIGTERPSNVLGDIKDKLAAAAELGERDPIKAAALLDRARRPFVQALSRLNKLLTDRIDNPAIRQRVQVQSLGRDPVRFGLVLEPQQIEIR